MKHNLKHLLAAASALLLFAGTIRAQNAPVATAPQTLSYQGELKPTGTTGNILAGNRLFTVTLYSDAAGTMQLWQTTMNVTVDSTGIFNCLLGSAQNPLPEAQAMDRPIWIGIAIDGSAEFRPLSQLTSSPYSMNVVDNAITTAKLADGAVTGTKIASGSIASAQLADSSITASKINTNYVSSISVNGQPITTVGTGVNIVTGDGLNATWVPDQSTLTLSNSGGGAGGAKTLSIGTAWAEGGNSDVGTTSPSDNYFGTQNSEPVWIRVDGGTTSGTTTGTVMRYIPGTEPNIIGGDAANSIGSSEGSVIAGGGNGSFPNTITGSFNAIGGGLHNNVSGGESGSTYSVVAGGDSNNVLSSYSDIGGGQLDTVQMAYSDVGGGEQNHIWLAGNDASYYYSFIGGGYQNLVKVGLAAIGGGDNNIIDTFADHSVIGGGQRNYIGGPFSVIAGGDSNIILATGADHNAIGGGYHNIELDPSFGTISGGANNYLWWTSWNSAIGGGWADSIFAPNDFIGAGVVNKIDSNSMYCVIGGGLVNFIDTAARSSGILGGDSNIIRSAYDVIGGGRGNKITANMLNAVIVGGDSNTISDLFSPGPTEGNFIGAGVHNLIDGNGFNVGIDTPQSSAIVAGRNNKVHEVASFVGAGENNQVRDDHDFIGAGAGNQLGEGTENAIVAGVGNDIITTASIPALRGHGSAFIGAGDSNQIIFLGRDAAIPSGDHLVAQEYGQTVMGFYNILSGINIDDTGSAKLNGEEPLVIVGNGGNVGGLTVRSNALEVTYNGHTVVYDNNGSGGSTSPHARPVIYGSSYQDNLFIGWANIPGGGTPGPLPITTIADFGVAQIINPTAGEYDITLNVVNPDGGGLRTLSNVSVSTTLLADPSSGVCNRTISTTGLIGTNVFKIFITDGSCTPQNGGFDVQVVGR